MGIAGGYCGKETYARRLAFERIWDWNCEGKEEKIFSMEREDRKQVPRREQ